ncbi:hypothetical protein KC951_03830, partial [Candidatus Saccharibacteria bacterium]|nr:hypothetical protein [Candidatus Saccharibacteria bacterium]
MNAKGIRKRGSICNIKATIAAVVLLILETAVVEDNWAGVISFAANIVMLRMSDITKTTVIIGYINRALNNRSHHCLKYFSVLGRQYSANATGLISTRNSIRPLRIISVAKTVSTAN